MSSDPKAPQVNNPVTFTYQFWEDGAAVDLTAATAAKIYFTDPSGNEDAQVAAINATPTTGKITKQFTVDEADVWYWQGEYTDPTGTYRGEKLHFHAVSN